MVMLPNATKSLEAEVAASLAEAMGEPTLLDLVKECAPQMGWETSHDGGWSGLSVECTVGLFRIDIDDWREAGYDDEDDAFELKVNIAAEKCGGVLGKAELEEHYLLELSGSDVKPLVNTALGWLHKNAVSTAREIEGSTAPWYVGKTEEELDGSTPSAEGTKEG